MAAGLLVGCTSGGTALTTVDAATRDALHLDAAADAPDATVDETLPTCAAGETNRLPVDASPVPGLLVVSASGAIAYSHRVGMGPPTTPPAIEIAATLTAVDVATSTLHLTTDDGSLDVTVTPVASDVLLALPVGRPVTARFENGVALTDATGLLFAAMSVSLADELDVASVHVAQTTHRCASVRFGSFDCVFGMVSTDLAVTVSDATDAISSSAPTTSITVADRALSVTWLRSETEISTAELGTRLVPPLMHCGPGITTELAVVIGPL